MSVIIHKKPSARHNQPMGFSGRLEAMRAPTSGKTKKSPEPSRPTVVRPAFQLLGTSAERASTNSATLPTNTATQRAASDQASQAAVRLLIPPDPRPCPLAPSVTTLLYSTTVS